MEDLTVGEAFYMVGNLAEASLRLSGAVKTGEPAQVTRALYILGRISLLTGDFRQAKEYFERSAESTDRSADSWMAFAGIGDALYAGGIYEEAIRRYRIAQGKAGGDVERAIIALKMALCENALGKEKEGLAHLREALKRIPVLSGWVGREEEFYHSMAMVGIDVREGEKQEIYVLAGPVRGNFNSDEVVGSDVPVREVRKQGKTYLEYGPLTDQVEAMILSEGIKTSLGVPVEVVTR
ncbi:MAG: tetratricopeptide repeat protein [bacterium]|nr:tetratricopeptide repeat protein [bacterium]